MNAPFRVLIKSCKLAFPFWMLAVFFSLFRTVEAAEMQAFPRHVPEALAGLQPLGHLPSTNQLHLAIGLPLRNRDALTNFLHRLYNPASPDYHQYLTPDQFTEMFGPTRQDYQEVIQFALSNNLVVTGTHDSRRIVDVTGNLSDIEKAFHVTLQIYQHPTEPRQFYAPNVNPSVDAGLPIADISGLSDYAVLRPASHKKTDVEAGIPASGSQASGYYIGNDFRNAYVPGAALDGAGQSVGIFEADGYYANDITAYETLAHLPSAPLVNVLIDGFNGAPGANNSEVALDIELAISMAPGLASVVLFEGPNNESDWIDILDSMSSSNEIKQFSSSWGYTGGEDPNTGFDAVFQAMAAQGQSFFQASGDGDAWTNPIWTPADSPYVTCVGGTFLNMNGSGASYSSESVWNSGNLGTNDIWSPNGNGYWGSGGGVSTVYSIPTWQQSLNFSANNGSAAMRNIPDVAMVADDVWVLHDNGQSGSFMGTSCSAPLWAAFTALVNEQALANGDAGPGLMNPAIYALGQTPSYATCFNDIDTGNNTNAQSAGLYSATYGYDLCTGWGTPAGTNLINAFAPLDSLQAFPLAGFTSQGGAGGPFTITSQTYTLTNTGADTLPWAAATDAPWLTLSANGGTLAPGGPADTLTVSLNSTATNEVAGIYDATVWFTNLADNVVEPRFFTLNVIAPPSFTMLPTNQFVFAGANVTFTAATSGGLPQSFQWQKNGANLTDGVNLSGSATLSLSLSNVTSASAGSYTLIASNIAGTATSAPPAVLTILSVQQLIQNGGFETGDFTDWTQSGNTAFTGVTNLPGYVHSGQYGVQAGPASTLGYISQTIATVPGREYQISLWFELPVSEGPSEFSVAWNGTTLYDHTSLPQFSWSNLQFTVSAAATTSTLKIGFRDDDTYFGLDDISVVPATPNLQYSGQDGAAIAFGWMPVQGGQYQIQTTTNLAGTWTPLGSAFTANYPFNIATNLMTNTQQFYRVVLVP
jgi:hypothetical protein